MSIRESKLECHWCGWVGQFEEANPLGTMTEEEKDETGFIECPKCGEPTPQPIES